MNKIGIVLTRYQTDAFCLGGKLRAVRSLFWETVNESRLGPGDCKLAGFRC